VSSQHGKPGRTRATSQERPWLTTITHAHSTQSASRNLSAGRRSLLPPAFQGVIRSGSPGWGRVRGWPAQCPGVPLHRQGRPKIISNRANQDHWLSFRRSSRHETGGQGRGRTADPPLFRRVRRVAVRRRTKPDRPSNWGTMAGCRLVWPNACRRWLPIWLPDIVSPANGWHRRCLAERRLTGH
jgi:hypothetical protein